MASPEEKPPRIPVFKSSGNIMNDLKNIKIAEMIGFGAWRGKLRKYLEENGNSTVLSDGNIGYSLYEEFKEDALDTDRRPSNNSFVQNMLESAGMDREGITKFKSDMKSEKFKIYWKGKIVYNSNVLKNIQDWIDAQVLLADVAYFKLEYAPKKYKESVYPNRVDRVDYLYRKLESDLTLYEELSSDISRVNSGVYEDPPLPFYTGTDIHTLQDNSFLDTVTIRLFDSADVEIIDDPDTPDIDEGYFDLCKILKLMTLISSEKLFTTRIVESYLETDEDIGGENYKVHNVVEKWELDYVVDFADNNIDTYHLSGEEHTVVSILLNPEDPFQANLHQEENGEKYIDIFWADIEEKVDSIGEFSEDIFVKENGVVYLTRKGLVSASPDDLAKAFSDNFGVKHIPKKSSRWLRILIIIIMIIIIIYTGGAALSAVSQMSMTVMSIVQTVIAVMSFINAIANLLNFLEGPDTNSNDDNIEEDDEATDSNIEEGCDDEYDTFCQFNRPKPYDNDGEFPMSISFEKLNKVKMQLDPDVSIILAGMKGL